MSTHELQFLNRTVFPDYRMDYHRPLDSRLPSQWRIDRRDLADQKSLRYPLRNLQHACIGRVLIGSA